MNRKWQHVGVLAVVAASIGLPAQSATAQSEDELIEEVVTVGSRSAKPRSASDSPVPVDVIGGEAFNALGSTKVLP